MLWCWGHIEKSQVFNNTIWDNNDFQVLHTVRFVCLPLITSSKTRCIPMRGIYSPKLHIICELGYITWAAAGILEIHTVWCAIVRYDDESKATVVRIDSLQMQLLMPNTNAVIVCKIGLLNTTGRSAIKFLVYHWHSTINYLVAQRPHIG